METTTPTQEPIETPITTDDTVIVAEEIEAKTFADFGVDPRVVEALATAGIIAPFPIQALTLPVALGGRDIIGQAKTGTGKTFGFGIPALQAVIGPGDDGWDKLKHAGAPQALIVVPTRELAVQVARDLDLAGKKRSVRVVQIYGGRAYEPQVEQLVRGAEIIVGTPGRLIDLTNQRKLNLSQVKVVVLDEADEMLDLGFLPDVEKIISKLPVARQTMLFSATMPGAVVAMARRYMTRPTHIRAADPDDEGATVKAVTQFVYRAHSLDKVEMLARLLQAEGRGLTIVFTRTKRTAAKVVEDLTERGFAAAAIHGDLGQGAREQALRAFRSGKVDVLVATDVAARGIDVDDVTHVVNFQCPEDEKTYLHRIGRTARAGNKGTAVTFVDWDDLSRWSLIERALGLDLANPPETYSTSPNLFLDLNIPEGTKGRLPRTERTRAGLGAERLEDLGETGKRTSRSGGATKTAGGRSKSGGSNRTGRARSNDETTAGNADRPPRKRNRQRTRAGQPTSDDQHSGSVATTQSSPAHSSVPKKTSADKANDGSDTASSPRRKRTRTRKTAQAVESTE